MGVQKDTGWSDDTSRSVSNASRQDPIPLEKWYEMFVNLIGERSFLRLDLFSTLVWLDSLTILVDRCWSEIIGQ